MTPRRMENPDRQWLGHARPGWVDDKLPVFLTICTRPRGENQLCKPEVWEALLAASDMLRNQGKWNPLAMVCMPDHLHALAQIPRHTRIAMVVRSLKTAVSIRQPTEWQRGAFDHRVRSRTQIAETLEYMRLNPPRAGLCERGEVWPYSRKW